MSEVVGQQGLVPFVSVIIPSFRGGRFLREAVESVQDQTFKDWEVVVVLDGCEDDLSDIQNDKRIRVLRQRNRGVSVARNVGIDHAGADLVALLDDDDRMLPDRLKVQVDLMRDENIGLCHSQYSVIDADGQFVRPGGAVGVQYADLLRGNGGWILSSVMVRKRVVQELGGFNSLLALGEDVDFVWRVAAQCVIGFLPEVLTEYRRHGDNTWSSATTTREMKLILNEHLLAARTSGSRELQKAAAIGLSNVMSGRAVFAMHRAREAQNARNYGLMFLRLAEALVSSPRGTIRATSRSIRRD